MKQIIVVALALALALAGVAGAPSALAAPEPEPAPAPAPAAGRVYHVPPADADAGTALELIATAPPAVPSLVAHYRATGAQAFASIELVKRDDQRWVAVVPPEAVVPPGVEYYLTAGGAPVFASAAAPHTTRVGVTSLTARRVRDEARVDGRRSRVHARAEWVDYGKRTVSGTRVLDRYYRIDADFSYRLWAYPLEELRVGFSRLLGDTQAAGRSGFNVAGWFELGLAQIEGVALDARAVVLATPESVALGGRAEVRVGVRDGTHVASGVEYLADVGTTGFFRFGWGTVPLTPMSATVEITDLPASTSDVGVRIYYDVTRVISHGLRIGLRAGYAARQQNVPGFTGGTTASIDF
ncbi:MAG TPA: hypothetical protein VNO30_09210 [Kofleriaceae bacterium]|nr:hypothetical protein [Kofleriaceae bacterium]